MNAIKRDKFGNVISPGNFVPSNTKICKKYSFEPLKRRLEIKESDFKSLVSVINVTTGDLIFNPSKSISNGETKGRTVFLNADLSNCNASDELLILYEFSKEENSLKLEKIINLLEKNNELLIEILS